MSASKIKLTAQRQRFVDEYLASDDLNASAAVRRAGYKRKASVMAAELMRMPHIKAAIDAAMAKRAERTGIDQDWVVVRLKENIERCRQAAPVLDRLGNQVFIKGPDGKRAALFAYDARGVNAGLSLAMDHVGMKRQRLEHSGPNGGPIPLASTSVSYQAGDPRAAMRAYQDIIASGKPPAPK